MFVGGMWACILEHTLFMLFYYCIKPFVLELSHTHIATVEIVEDRIHNNQHLPRKQYTKAAKNQSSYVIVILSRLEARG